MRTFALGLLYAAAVSGAALHTPSSALKRTAALALPRAPAASAMSSTASGAYEGEQRSGALDKAADRPDEWAAKVQTPTVQALRADLISQYLRLGRTEAHAQQDVDEFLADKARSHGLVAAREASGAATLPLLAVVSGAVLLKLGADVLGGLP